MLPHNFRAVATDVRQLFEAGASQSAVHMRLVGLCLPISLQKKYRQFEISDIETPKTADAPTLRMRERGAGPALDI